MTTVLLLDDHPLIVSGLATHLATKPNIDVVGQVYSPTDALAFLQQNEVDVLVSDMSFNTSVEGTQLMLSIREKHPNLNVIFYSMIEKVNEVRDAILAGAKAYVLKKYNADAVYEAIVAVRNNQMYYSPELVPILARTPAPAIQPDEQPDPVRALTPREREVMTWIARELPNREIAQKLFLSESTIQSHRVNLMTKLGVTSNVGIAYFAFRYGLVS